MFIVILVSIVFGFATVSLSVGVYLLIWNLFLTNIFPMITLNFWSLFWTFIVSMIISSIILNIFHIFTGIGYYYEKGERKENPIISPIISFFVMNILFFNKIPNWTWWAALSVILVTFLLKYVISLVMKLVILIKYKKYF